MPLNDLAVYLQARLRPKGTISQRALAKFAGLSSDTVSRLYHGEVRRPTFETLERLADFFREPFIRMLQLGGYLSQDQANGVSTRLDGDEVELVAVWRQLPSDRRDELKRMARLYLDDTRRKRPAANAS